MAKRVKRGYVLLQEKRSSLKGERIGVQSTRSAWKLIISSPLIEEAPGKSRSIKMQNRINKTCNVRIT